MIEDAKVQDYWNKFGTRSSAKAAAAGFPDFFIYKICEGYLYGRELELQFVEGNGNCLPNSILKQVNFNMDPGSEFMYTQTYLRRQAIMHLIANWEVLGEEIKENIKISYGRPDSIVGGLKLKKVSGRGKTRKEEYGYSVMDWCKYILRDGSWCDEIFIKLVASMWGCKIAVLRSDSLHSTTYRYEGSFHLADIILMYNGNPVKGHYSPVGHCGKDLVFESNSIDYLKFSPNYKKNVDLEERLDRRDSIWDLDDEKLQKRIFTKKRGYAFGSEDKAEKEKGKDSGKVIGEALMLKEDEIIVKKQVFEDLENRMKMLEEKVPTITEDEVVMKKKDIEEKEKRIKELEKRTAGIGDDEVIIKKTELEAKDECIRQLEKHCNIVVGEDEVIMKKKDVEEKDEKIRRLEEGGPEIQEDEMVMKRAHVETLVKKIEDFEKVDEDPTAKRIVMKNFQMLIRIDHYENMRDRCLDLENKLKEASGEDNVIVQEKSLKAIEAEIEHVRKNLSLIAEGKEVEEVVDRTLTPRKRRAGQSDQPPSKTMAQMVAKKTVEMDKEMPDNLPRYKKGDTYCDICKEEHHTHHRLVSHYQKHHENKSMFTCRECGKGFMTANGQRKHMKGHDIAQRIKCTDNTCTKTFTDKLGLKAHLKLKHSGEKEMIKCNFAEKGCKKTFTIKGNMTEHTVKCKFNPNGLKEMFCEICKKGGFYMAKRILAHKRACHGWD